MEIRGLYQNKQVRRVLFCIGVITAIYLVFNILVIGGYPVFLITNDIASPVAALAAASLFGLAGHHQKDRVTRGLWVGMAIGLGLWGIADTIWSFYEIILKQDVVNPTIADLFFVLGYVPMYFALAIRIANLRVQPTRRQKQIQLVVSLLWIALTAIYVLRPILMQLDENSLLQAGLDIFYPLGDMGLAILASIILILLNKGRFALSWGLIFAGIFIMTVSDLLYSYSTWQDLYYPNGTVNALTVVVSTTYTLAYISCALGIYLHGKIQEAKEAYTMRLEMAPLVRFYALVYTNKQNQMISISSNFHYLVEAPAEADYHQVKLEEALALTEQDSKKLAHAIAEQEIISNYPLTITTADHQTRQVWVTALADKDASGDYNGANIALRANLNAPEYLRLPQGQEMGGVLRYLLARAGTLSKDESPSLRAYFVEVIRLFSSLLHQYGGTSFQHALFSELSLTAIKNNLDVTFTNQAITVPEECEGPDLAQTLLPLLHAARTFTASVVGDEVAKTEIEEFEHQLDPGIIKDLDKYGMRA
jgi:hypothetical protein